MPDDNIEKLTKKTYLTMLENSVGSRLFNSAWVQFKDSGEEKDVLQDGVLSCAFFVSGILTILGAIDKPHTTVATTQEKLEESDKWRAASTDSIKPGDVLIWEKITFKDGTSNEHIGFALGDEEAASSSYKEHRVVKHHITFGQNKDGTPARKIIAVYRYNNF